MAFTPNFKQCLYQSGSEQDDTIDVLAFDGNDPCGKLFAIEKAYGLRRFDYDGITYTDAKTGITWEYAYVDQNTRTATSDEDTPTIETQRITPDYESIMDNVVVAVTNIEGFNFQLEGVEWIDANFGGRCWAVDSSA